MAKKKEERKENNKLQEFIDEYKKLCYKHGYNFVSVPTLKKQDNGTYGIAVERRIGKVQENS